MRTKSTVGSRSRGKRASSRRFMMDPLERRVFCGTWASVYLSAEAYVDIGTGSSYNDYLTEAWADSYSSTSSAFSQSLVYDTAVTSQAAGGAAQGGRSHAETSARVQDESGRVTETWAWGETAWEPGAGNYRADSAAVIETASYAASGYATSHSDGAMYSGASASEDGVGYVAVNAVSEGAPTNTADTTATYEAMSGAYTTASVDGAAHAADYGGAYTVGVGDAYFTRAVAGGTPVTVPVDQFAWTFNAVPDSGYQISLTVYEDVNGDGVGDTQLFSGTANSDYVNGNMVLSTSGAWTANDISATSSELRLVDTSVEVTPSASAQNIIVGAHFVGHAWSTEASGDVAVSLRYSIDNWA